MTTRQLKPCGTYAAWTRHYRNGEPIDDACDEAARIYVTNKQREIRERPSNLPPCIACGGPRKPFQGGFGWCNACYQRWRYAGQPEDGPPPRYAPNTALREDYHWLRDNGTDLETAAERVGIKPATAQKWDAMRTKERAA